MAKAVKVRRTLSIEYTIQPPEEDLNVVAMNERELYGEELFRAIVDHCEYGTESPIIMTNTVEIVDVEEE